MLKTKNFTMTQNKLSDEMFKDLPLSAIAVMSYIITKTNGWNKTSDHIALTQFEENIQHTTRKTIVKQLKLLEENQFILVDRTANKNGNKYTIHPRFVDEDSEGIYTRCNTTKTPKTKTVKQAEKLKSAEHKPVEQNKTPAQLEKVVHLEQHKQQEQTKKENIHMVEKPTAITEKNLKEKMDELQKGVDVLVEKITYNIEKYNKNGECAEEFIKQARSCITDMETAVRPIKNFDLPWNSPLTEIRKKFLEGIHNKEAHLNTNLTHFENDHKHKAHYGE